MAYKEEIDILIVGNGLDLTLGFKTKYEHFHSFVDICITNKTKHSKEILELFLGKIDDSILSYYEDRGLTELIASVRKYSHSFFINYFQNMHQKIDSWYSFEDELEYILKCFDSLFNYIINGNYLLYEYNSTSETIKGCFFLDSFVNFLRLEECSKNNELIDIKLMTRKESSIILEVKHKLEKEHSDSELREIFINEYKKVPKILFSELGIFSRLFAFYLNVFVGDGSDAVFDKCDIHTKLCINYNYTGTASLNLKAKSIISAQTISINGAIDLYKKEIKDNNSLYKEIKWGDKFVLPETDIVFGISFSDFKDVSYLRFCKRIQRILNYTGYNKLEEKLNAIKRISSSVIRIGVLGHSLSSCDFETLSYITDYFYNYNNEIQFIVYYFNDEDLISKTSNLSQLLNDRFKDMYSDKIITRKIQCFFHKSKE